MTDSRTVGIQTEFAETDHQGKPGNADGKWNKNKKLRAGFLQEAEEPGPEDRAAEVPVS